MGAGEALSSSAGSRSPFGSILRNVKRYPKGSLPREDTLAWHQEVLLGSGSTPPTPCHLSGGPSGSELYFICMVSAPASPALIKTLPAFALYCLVNV